MVFVSEENHKTLEVKLIGHYCSINIDKFRKLISNFVRRTLKCFNEKNRNVHISVARIVRELTFLLYTFISVYRVYAALSNVEFLFFKRRDIIGSFYFPFQ